MANIKIIEDKKVKNLKSIDDNDIRKPFIQSQNGVLNSVEIGDLQGSMQELNKDEYDEKNKTSSIDLRSNLHEIELSSIIVIDALVQLKMLPKEALPITLQKKRLSVSLNGKGREQIVDIVRGKLDNDVRASGGGLSDTIKGFFKGKQ